MLYKPLPFKKTFIDDKLAKKALGGIFNKIIKN